MTTIIRLRDWLRLPSGRLVSVRKIEPQHGRTCATVRYVGEQGELETGAFCLSLEFLVKYAARVEVCPA